jgi:hypothetical protein
MGLRVSGSYRGRVAGTLVRFGDGAIADLTDEIIAYFAGARGALLARPGATPP